MSCGFKECPIEDEYGHRHDGERCRASDRHCRLNDRLQIIHDRCRDVPKPAELKELKNGNTIKLAPATPKRPTISASPPVVLVVDDVNEPPLRERMQIEIELYDDFSLAFWKQMPGQCGSGPTPAMAVDDLFDTLLHNNEAAALLPDSKCAPDLIKAKPLLKKFFAGLSKGEVT